MTGHSTIEAVRKIVGELDWSDSAPRWSERAEEDPIALAMAVHDFYKASRRSDIRHPAAWLYRAWCEQRNLQIKHERGRA